MISIKEVEEIHSILIKNFGGVHGIRDTNGLESALSRPFQTFDGNELYISVEEKAAAVLESILINHPFIDGNKRTGYVLMMMLILKNEKKLKASKEEKYGMVIKVAEGKMKYDDIVIWLKARVIPSL